MSTAGCRVWGVLCEVPRFLIERETAREKSRLSLDQIEGEGTNYGRRSIHVKSLDGTVCTAITYTAIKLVTGVQTNLNTFGTLCWGFANTECPMVTSTA